MYNFPKNTHSNTIKIFATLFAISTTPIIFLCLTTQEALFGTVAKFTVILAFLDFRLRARRRIHQLHFQKVLVLTQRDRK